MPLFGYSMSTFMESNFLKVAQVGQKKIFLPKSLSLGHLFERTYYIFLLFASTQGTKWELKAFPATNSGTYIAEELIVN